MELTELQHRLRNHEGLSKRIKCDQTGQEFPSIAEACRTLGLRASALSMVLHGKQAHTGGYTFSFLEPYPRKKENDEMVMVNDRKEQARNYDQDQIEFELMGGEYHEVLQSPELSIGDVLIHKDGKAVIYGLHSNVAGRLNLSERVLRDWVMSGNVDKFGRKATVITSNEQINAILRGALFNG